MRRTIPVTRGQGPITGKVPVTTSAPITSYLPLLVQEFTAGENIAANQVVYLFSNATVKIAAAAGLVSVIGVAYKTRLSGESIPIIVFGPAAVVSDDVVVAGELVTSSSTSGRAELVSGNHIHTWGPTQAGTSHSHSHTHSLYDTNSGTSHNHSHVHTQDDTAPNGGHDHTQGVTGGTSLSHTHNVVGLTSSDAPDSPHDHAVSIASALEAETHTHTNPNVVSVGNHQHTNYAVNIDATAEAAHTHTNSATQSDATAEAAHTHAGGNTGNGSSEGRILGKVLFGGGIGDTIRIFVTLG